jgi:suppressor of ftsI
LVVAVALASTGAALIVTQAQPNAARQSSEQIVKAIESAPFKAGLPFREPPVLRSSHGRLRGTLVAQTGPIEVSGIRVENAQSYALAGQQRGLLGPTLHARPGDLVDLVLDNELVQPQPVPGTAGADLAQPMAHGECGHDTTIAPGEPQPTNFHFHGLHVTPRNHKVGDVTYYGDNVVVCLRPGERHIRFRIPRNHDLGAFWYHAHLHGLTDDQVYRGLAGLLTIGDARRYLPTRFARVRTHYLSLKDIQVQLSGGGLAIPTDHDWAHQTHRTVNGLVDPKLTMRPGETQLWHVGNSSSALWYRIALVDGNKRDPFTVVSQDANPMIVPQRTTSVLIGPGHRVDILVRAPRSGSQILKTLAFNQGRLIFGEDVLATIDVAGAPAPDIDPPGRSGTLPAFPSTRGPKRTWKFSIKGAGVAFLINGKQFNPRRIDAQPRLGTTERWVLINKSSEWHPIHIHQDDYRVVSVNRKRVMVRSDQDVVPLPPQRNGVDGRVELDMPFQDYSGRYVMHCHILDHEDGGMMAQIKVLPARRP